MHVEAAHIEAHLESLRLRRKRQARIRLLKRAAIAALCLVVVGALAAAFVYAGSPDRLAKGVRIAGVDVGGLTPKDATRLLERREAALGAVPIVVHAGARTYRVRAADVGLDVNWRAAVDEAASRGDGLGPIRGFRRLVVRAFGADVTPSTTVDRRAIDDALERMARAVDVPHRDAAIRLAGLRPVVVAAREGLVIDRKAAAGLIIGSFAALARAPVTLPLATERQRVTAAMLRRAASQTRLAVSATDHLRLGDTRYRLSRRQVAELLKPPRNGARSLRIGGPGADAYFLRLEKLVATPAKDADFVVASGGQVLIKPSVDGRVLDVPVTADRVLGAALSPTRRTATIAVAHRHPARTTEDAKAMGIGEIVSSYTTIYGGIANRIHNVQLVAGLIDDTLVAPGHTFSFNGTTGERNAAKGFLEAPVIVNGELQTGLGGGVCQVSTTVFNAAYEAGLKITARTNHALYISHYPQGRDATVDYPGVDLRFVNDTGHWLLLRTFVSASSLTVNLYGTDPQRRVESEVSPLHTAAAPPLVRVKDKTLFKGKKVVEEEGSPARSTSVHRRVYTKSGKLLYDNVWYSSYRGEKRVIRVGVKPKPKPKPAQEPIIAIPPGL